MTQKSCMTCLYKAESQDSDPCGQCKNYSEWRPEPTHILHKTGGKKKIIYPKRNKNLIL